MHMVCVSEGKGGGKKPVRRLGGTLRSEIHLGLSCRAKIFLPAYTDRQARIFRTRPAWFLVARRKERCLVPRWEAGSRRVAERKKTQVRSGFSRAHTSADGSSSNSRPFLFRVGICPPFLAPYAFEPRNALLARRGVLAVDPAACGNRIYRQSRRPSPLKRTTTSRVQGFRRLAHRGKVHENARFPPSS